MPIDLNAFITICGFIITIATLIWKMASIKSELDVRLAILETEFKCFNKKSQGEK